MTLLVLIEVIVPICSHLIASNASEIKILQVTQSIWILFVTIENHFLRRKA